MDNTITLETGEKAVRMSNGTYKVVSHKKKSLTNGLSPRSMAKAFTKYYKRKSYRMTKKETVGGSPTKNMKKPVSLKTAVNMLRKYYTGKH